MAAMQRFCPLCDRAFVEGEAVLACQGCGVLYHPGCWVKNDGCATPGEHDQASTARAYRTDPSTGRTQPGDGLRQQREAGAPVAAPSGLVLASPASEPPRAATRPTPMEIVRGTKDPEPVVDRDPSAAAPRLASRPLEPPGAAVRHGRYVPPEEEFVPVRKPLPGIYKERRWLQYWYIPAAVAVALVVAAGVVFVVAKISSGSNNDRRENPSSVFEATATPTPSPTATPTGTAQPTSIAGPTATATARPTGGKFEIGQVLVVAGAGDCLNVRVAADRTKDAIVCLQDGSEVTVTGGPEKADSFTWWKVNTKLGEGWAVEDFLSKKP